MAASPKWNETRYQCQLGVCRQHARCFPTWADLIDHLINYHQCRFVDGKLLHYNTAVQRELDGRV